MPGNGCTGNLQNKKGSAHGEAAAFFAEAAGLVAGAFQGEVVNYLTNFMEDWAITSSSLVGIM